MESRDLECRVDSLFAEWDKPDSPGASVLIVKDGETLLKKGYGCANLEYGIPITPATVFHVASVSKQFTAMAVAMLAHEGKLSLDDRVQKYVPELSEFEQPITIRHLIHHVSGLRDQWELLTLAGWRMDDVITVDHLMKIITRQKKLNFEPGSKYLYSNSGYTLLAMIVERVSGKQFPEYVQDTILEPLGMRDSHIHYDHQRIVKNRAYSYSPKPGGGFRKSVLSYANYGATSLFTTTEDLAKWMMNYSTAEVGGPEVISQMHETYTLIGGESTDYAFGLMQTKYKDLQVIYHGGSDAGFRSYFGYFPERGLGMIILSNASTFAGGRVAMKIAGIFLDDESAKEDAGLKDAEPAEVTKVRYDACPGTYLAKSLGKLLEIGLTDGRLTIQLEGWAEPLLLVKEAPSKEVLAKEAAEVSEGLAEGEFLPGDMFTAKEKAAQVTFMSREGKVVFLTLNLDGRSLGARKIDIEVLTEQELLEYTGTYYSDELDTAYHLRIVDGELVAQHRRHKDIVLVATGQDRFLPKSGPLSTVDFARNEQNEVTGFSHTGGRVVNLEFRKQGQRA